MTFSSGLKTALFLFLFFVPTFCYLNVKHNHVVFSHRNQVSSTMSTWRLSIVIDLDPFEVIVGDFFVKHLNPIRAVGPGITLRAGTYDLSLKSPDFQKVGLYGFLRC